MALAPAAAISFYIWSRRTHHVGYEFIGLTLGIGASVALLALGVELLFGWIVPLAFENVHLTSFLSAFFSVALTEETAKFAVLLFIVVRHEDCRAPLDVMCGAVLVGLGFAAMENVFYIVGNSEWHRVGTLRSFTAVPAHAAFGVVMGYFAAIAFAEAERGRKYWILSLLVPILAHGAYDWPLIELAALDSVRVDAIVYFIAFWLVLVVVGTAAVKLIEARRVHGSSIHRASSPGSQDLWRPPPVFWQVVGAILLAASFAAPAIGYFWKDGGWQTTGLLLPVVTLPVIFGFSLVRFGSGAANAR